MNINKNNINHYVNNLKVNHLINDHQWQSQYNQPSTPGGDSTTLPANARGLFGDGIEDWSNLSKKHMNISCYYQYTPNSLHPMSWWSPFDGFIEFGYYILMFPCDTVLPCWGCRCSIQGYEMLQQWVHLGDNHFGVFLHSWKVVSLMWTFWCFLLSNAPGVAGSIRSELTSIYR